VRTNRRIWLLALVGLLGMGCEQGSKSSREEDLSERAQETPERPGIPLVEPAQRQLAPDLRGVGLTGDPWTLAEHRGKVVVIDFWATWCGPCRATIPHMVEIARDWGPRGVAVVGISLDRGGSELVSPFAAQMGINYPVVVDGEARLASSLGGVEAIPTFFLIDRQGKLAAQVRGAVPKELLTGAVESLLAEG
jgi:thiol-disulfide isomerase/thioredoxin